jgi:hypothetical protein
MFNMKSKAVGNPSPETINYSEVTIHRELRNKATKN